MSKSNDPRTVKNAVRHRWRKIAMPLQLKANLMCDTVERQCDGRQCSQEFINVNLAVAAKICPINRLYLTVALVGCMCPASRMYGLLAALVDTNPTLITAASTAICRQYGNCCGSKEYSPKANKRQQLGKCTGHSLNCRSTMSWVKFGSFSAHYCRRNYTEEVLGIKSQPFSGRASDLMSALQRPCS